MDQSLVSKIAASVQGVIAREGFELVETELVTEGHRRILRLFIDRVPPGVRERGITVDDCSLVSRVVGDILDVEELISGEYSLEVSSPGIFRPLTKPDHFDRAIGEKVKVKIHEKREGRRVFVGILRRREGDAVTVDVDGTEYSVPLSEIAKANLEPSL